MRTLCTQAVSAALLLTVSLGAQSPDAAKPSVEDGHVVHPDGIARIPLPQTWRVTRTIAGKLTDEPIASTNLLGFSADVLAVDGGVSVDVWILNGAAPEHRLQAIRDRAQRLRTGTADPESYRLGLEPLVHGEYQSPGESDEVELIVYRRIAGRTASILFTAPANAIAALRPKLFEIAEGLVGTWEPWPALPECDDMEEVDGFRVAFTSDVSSVERKDVLRLVKATVKRFAKDHDELEFERVDRPVLLVSGNRTTNAQFVAQDGAPDDSMWHFQLRRLASVPMLGRSPDARADLVGLIYRHLCENLYPDEFGAWVGIGEAAAVGFEEQSGRRLPAVPKGAREFLARIDNDCEAVVRDQVNPFAHEYSSWTIFFRYGPSKYRKAYEAFLEEMRTTLDPAATFERHLGEFDAGELRREASQFLRDKLVEVELR